MRIGRWEITVRRRAPRPSVEATPSAEVTDEELIRRLDDLKRRWIAGEVSMEMARWEDQMIHRERSRLRGYL